MSNTFIFFDLETTGLITNNCMPKITELSLIAVSRNAICNTTKTLPRVLSKLVLPINPVTYISENVETITGLSSQNLEDVKSFTCETHGMIINFIKQLIPPVCFVAYNGYKFDYPIFLKELENINKDVSEEILCIDMMHLIINFFSNKDSLSKKSAIQANTSTFYNT
ncbi:MAG: exonuclease domain-containing protein [Wolbachia endosymbiont of Halictus tumulorum]|nr:exonuclease domain-containing protein [Wolbachia endosymbiont of Halictus tumulorum]